MTLKTVASREKILMTLRLSTLRLLTLKTVASREKILMTLLYYIWSCPVECMIFSNIRSSWFFFGLAWDSPMYTWFLKRFNWNIFKSWTCAVYLQRRNKNKIKVVSLSEIDVSVEEFLQLNLYSTECSQLRGLGFWTTSPYSRWNVSDIN